MCSFADLLHHERRTALYEALDKALFGVCAAICEYADAIPRMRTACVQQARSGRTRIDVAFEYNLGRALVDLHSFYCNGLQAANDAKMLDVIRSFPVVVTLDATLAKEFSGLQHSMDLRRRHDEWALVVAVTGMLSEVTHE